MNNQLSEKEFQTENPKNFHLSIGKSIIVAILIVVCLQFVASLINLPAMFEPKFYHITLPLSFMVGGLLSIFAVSAYLKTNWKTISAHLKISPGISVTLLSVLFYFSVLPFAEFLASLVPTTGSELWELFYREIIKGFEMLLNYKIAGFLTVCILAPIFEEILFRGILLRGLLQNQINPFLAIGLSAFLFGIAHLNPWQFMGAGMLGIAFGYVYYRTKSLWLCIFLHALNNTISFLMMIKYDTMEENLTNPNSWYIALAGLIVSILIGWIIFELTKKSVKWN